jgi:hypothetical protein
MFIGGAELTGTPTAPTATAGTNTTQIANTLFVNSAITTADSGNVKTTGSQSITGIKSFSNPNSAPIQVTTNNGNGILVNATTGIGLQATSSGNFTAANFTGQAGANTLTITNQSGSTGAGLAISNTGSGVSIASSGGSVNTFTVDKLGTTTATSFIKSAAPSTNLLLAGGGDISQFSLPFLSLNGGRMKGTIKSGLASSGLGKVTDQTLLNIYDGGASDAQYGIGISTGGGMEYMANQSVNDTHKFYGGTDNNSPTLQFKIAGNGQSTFYSTVTAPTFIGNLSGNATSADNLIAYDSGNLVKWGWDGRITYKLNSVDFGRSVPMDISGNASTATTANSATTLETGRSSVRTEAGSGDFSILQYNSSGNYLRQALGINNQTGAANFSSSVTSTGFVNSTAPATNILLANGTTIPQTGVSNISNSNLTLNADRELNGVPNVNGEGTYGLKFRDLKHFKTSAFQPNGKRAEFSLFPIGQPGKLFEIFANQDANLEGSPFLDGLTNLTRLGFYEFGGLSSSVDVYGPYIEYVSNEHIFKNGPVTIDNLAGSGTRALVADANGTLSTVASVDSRPYKVYTALLNQTGTNAPVATVLENTLGVATVWTRFGVGQYICTSNAFIAGKTTVQITRTNPTIPDFSINMGGQFSGTNTVGITTFNTTGYLDGQLTSATIEIRVYN